MKFLKTYALVLVVSVSFVFLGGYQLFDFSRRFFLATAACAFVLAVIAYAFEEQGEKIRQLERRIRELEEAARSEE